MRLSEKAFVIRSGLIIGATCSIFLVIASAASTSQHYGVEYPTAYPSLETELITPRPIPAPMMYVRWNHKITWIFLYKMRYLFL